MVRSDTSAGSPPRDTVPQPEHPPATPVTPRSTVSASPPGDSATPATDALTASAIAPRDASLAPEPRDASLAQVAGAVFWSFFGVRKGRHMQQDALRIRPHQVVIIGLLAGLLFVLALLTLVSFITRSAG